MTRDTLTEFDAVTVAGGGRFLPLNSRTVPTVYDEVEALEKELEDAKEKLEAVREDLRNAEEEIDSLNAELYEMHLDAREADL